MKENFLKNKNKPELKFELIPQTGLFETITDSDNKPIYALISYSVSSVNNKFNTIHILYLLNLKNYTYEEILVSETNIKANDVTYLLNQFKFPKDSIVLSLNVSPFTTFSVIEFFKNNEVRHEFYNKRHYIPILDYTKQYLHSMIFIALFNNKVITEKEIETITNLWNSKVISLISKVTEKLELVPNKLYLK